MLSFRPLQLFLRLASNFVKTPTSPIKHKLIKNSVEENIATQTGNLREMVMLSSSMSPELSSLITKESTSNIIPHLQSHKRIIDLKKISPTTIPTLLSNDLLKPVSMLAKSNSLVGWKHQITSKLQPDFSHSQKIIFAALVSLQAQKLSPLNKANINSELYPSYLFRNFLMLLLAAGVVFTNAGTAYAEVFNYRLKEDKDKVFVRIWREGDVDYLTLGTFKKAVTFSMPVNNQVSFEIKNPQQLGKLRENAKEYVFYDLSAEKVNILIDEIKKKGANAILQPLSNTLNQTKSKLLPEAILQYFVETLGVKDKISGVKILDKDESPILLEKLTHFLQQLQAIEVKAHYWVDQNNWHDANRYMRYLELKNIPKLEADMKNATDIARRTILKLELAKTYVIVGDYKKGIDTYQQVIDSFKGNKEAEQDICLIKYNQGMAYLYDGKFDKAISLFKSCVQEPDIEFQQLLQSALGDAYSFKNDFDEAKKAYGLSSNIAVMRGDIQSAQKYLLLSSQADNIASQISANSPNPILFWTIKLGKICLYASSPIQGGLQLVRAFNIEGLSPLIECGLIYMDPVDYATNYVLGCVQQKVFDKILTDIMEVDNPNVRFLANEAMGELVRIGINRYNSKKNEGTAEKNSEPEVGKTLPEVIGRIDEASGGKLSEAGKPIGEFINNKVIKGVRELSPSTADALQLGAEKVKSIPGEIKKLDNVLAKKITKPIRSLGESAHQSFDEAATIHLSPLAAKVVKTGGEIVTTAPINTIAIRTYPRIWLEMKNKNLRKEDLENAIRKTTIHLIDIEELSFLQQKSPKL